MTAYLAAYLAVYLAAYLAAYLADNLADNFVPYMASIFELKFKKSSQKIRKNVYFI
jgi:hypothetical protein